MYLLYFSIKSILSCWLHHKDLSHNDIIRSYRCYKEFRKQNSKSLWRILSEVNYLCKYWHCFPDMYFRFGHFLKQYDDMEVIKSFVPQVAYGKFCSKGLDNGPYAVLINDKIIFHDLMSFYQLPVSEMLFVFENDHFRSKGVLLDDYQVDCIIEKLTEDRIFIKRFTGGAASGISVFIRKDDAYYDNETKISAAYIRNQFQGQKVFFERQLVQESVLSSFNPDTVNTIRIMTLNINNNPQVISAAVRFGRVGSYVDNTAKGGVAVSLDIETGRLGEWGIREYNLNKFYEHPDSHKQFNGIEVTQWPQVKELVLRTLKVFPPYRSLGFDVATTNQGPVIIEINTGAGIYLSQMGKEIGLAHYFGDSIKRHCK